MKLTCAPKGYAFPGDSDLDVVLYGQPERDGRRRPVQGSAGHAVRSKLKRARLEPAQRAWDFLSLALAVVTADFAVSRRTSPDGWTRQIDLTVAVADPGFWATQSSTLEAALKFLSTDIWTLSFIGGGFQPAPPSNPIRPSEDCVVLLSGGLDSLIGAIDLVEQGRKPCAVSNVVPGDGENQRTFAEVIGGGLRHLALNHNATLPWAKENSQRARSLIFIAFAVLAATTLESYHDGGEVPLFICENGFIALNPSLTGSRLGSLSTRTVHPEFFNRVQKVLLDAGLRVRMSNPYEYKTKGEMLRACANQDLLKEHALDSVSCGRYRRYGYKHCGRCVPCQVRRAAFNAWGEQDETLYVFSPLGKSDDDHAKFDDVRAVAMAIAEAKDSGFDAWLGSSLSYPNVQDRAQSKHLIRRGLDELSSLHELHGVR